MYTGGTPDDANGMATMLYGYEHDELLAMTSPELSAEPERTALFIREAMTLPGQGAVAGQRLHRRRDGTTFQVEFTARTLARRGASLLLIACRDITERMATEQTIRQMALVLDVAPNAITVYDLDGHCLYANRKAFELHGYSPEEFLALDLPRILVAEDAGLMAARMGVLRERGEGAFEAEHYRKDGSILPLAVTARYTTWNGREAILAIDTDISMRRAAERALRDSKAELEAAQRVAHVGSWTWDPVADAAVWSDELFRIFGLEPGGPAPTLAEQESLHPADVYARICEALHRAARTGAGYELEYVIIRPDGTIRRLVERGEAVRDGGGVVRSVRGTLADVTELREAQARADQAQRAEMVGRLAGGIAHDFNNLLTAVAGYAELLDQSLVPHDPRHEDVAAIRAAARRAGSLTRQLLAFGRRDMLRPVVLAPGDVVAGLTSMLRSLVPAGIGLAVHCDPGAGTVWADRDQLEHALVNLVLNARDAMPDGGTLTLQVERLLIEPGDTRLRLPALPGAYVRIAVGDTGTGIEADLLPHIFEPFFTTKPFGQGSGLGLSSVDGFVAQTGGFLSVDTSPGAGSTFSMFLACTREAAAVPEQVPGTAEGPGSGTILLVDDEPSVRAVTARLLRQLGYSVIEAADPSEAMAACESAAALDLLVSDVVLPGMNGIELARRCVGRRPNLPVLFISGYGREALSADDQPASGMALLAKPFTAHALGTHVRALLDRSPGRQAGAGDPGSA